MKTISKIQLWAEATLVCIITPAALSAACIIINSIIG